MKIILNDNLIFIRVDIDYRGLSAVESDWLTDRAEELLKSAIAGLRGKEVLKEQSKLST